MFLYNKDAENYLAERKEIMTLNQILYFRKVARLENYHQAAEELYVYFTAVPEPLHGVS